ncbi:MAG: hypothetical protein UU12_C0007G0003 [Candidatus Woesebacteria bacterium GW2011_GWA2_40_7b]|uniref:Uncharacterized protein n=1 Tax=Candidatus Woesebacteria bacterium GW2011_GWA2_40_7b TaxID=1618563 RepID=A0A0G0W7F4_9BACT|nr:MAG: hypothetical protein UU12_C0007G0003 [Candidatus Woesebacteria bacterium GW2011_GWA2_40_7b]
MESIMVPKATFFNPLPRVPPISLEERIEIMMTRRVGTAIMKYEALYIRG